MKHIRSAVIGLMLALLGTAAQAQGCNGQFQPGRFCGNATGALGLPGPTLITPSIFQPIAGGTVIGNPTSAAAAPTATAVPVLGVPGSVQGSIALAGASSGAVTIKALAAAGLYNFNLPTSAGVAGSILQSGGGGAAAMTFTTATYPATAAQGTVLAAGAANVISASTAPILGTNGGTQGQITFSGSTSGGATIVPQAAAGTPTITLPNTSGTVAVGATTPLALSATTGGLTCATCVTSSGGGAITGTAPIAVSGAGAVSLNTNGVTYAFLQQVGALSIVGNGTNATANATSLAGTANQIVRVNGAGTAMGFGSIDLSQSAAVGATILPLANGGTNAALTASNGGILWSNATQAQILAGTATARLPMLSGATATPVWGAYTLPASVTSGGIPFFSSTTVQGSSALLTANAIMLGGGAGVAPLTLGSLGTTSTVLHGNAAGAPTFGSVANADMATMADGTIKSNVSGGTAIPSDNTITSVMDKLLGTTQGSLMYRNASSWVALGPGSNGQLLNSGGPAANPSWQTAAGGGNVSNSGTPTAGQGAVWVTATTIKGVSQPTVVTYTSGSGTYTPAAGVTWFEVTATAAGGGGAGGGPGAGNGTAGGNTTFSGTGTSITAAGGGFGTTGPSAGNGGTATGGDTNLSGGTGTNAISGSAGGPGGVSYWGGGASLGSVGGTYGTGGYGGGGATNAGGGGAGGATAIKLVTSPAASYSYAIGAAGSGGTVGSGGGGGVPGMGGFIRIVEHYGS